MAATSAKPLEYARRLLTTLSLGALLMCLGMPSAMATISSFNCSTDPGVGTIACGPANGDSLPVEKSYQSVLGSMYVSLSAVAGTTSVTFNEIIHNYTGVAWSGFNFQLGEEFGAVQLFQAIFSVPIAVFDPAVPPSPYLTVLFASPIAAGDSFTVGLSASIGDPGGALFNLAQTPLQAVPVPAPLALLLPALAGLWYRRLGSAA